MTMYAHAQTAHLSYQWLWLANLYVRATSSAHSCVSGRIGQHGRSNHISADLSVGETGRT